MAKAALQHERTSATATVRSQSARKRSDKSGIISKVVAAAADAERGNVGPDLTKLSREQRRRILFGE